MPDRWRVGKKVPINVYEGERPICQCQTAVDARMIVSAVKGRYAHMCRDGHEQIGYSDSEQCPLCRARGERDLLAPSPDLAHGTQAGAAASLRSGEGGDGTAPVGGVA